jgi:hypothetical protein
MKTTSLTILILLSVTLNSFSQKVSDILEKGIEIKSNERIFIIKNGTNFMFDKNTGVANNYQQYPDSCIFLIHNKTGVNIYLQPLNPLKYSYDSKTIFIPDPINAAADKAFASISALLANVTGAATTGGATDAAAKNITLQQFRLNKSQPKHQNIKATKAKTNACNCPTCNLTDVTNNLKRIKDSLALDPHNRITAIFNKLRDSLDFINTQTTHEGIKQVFDSIGVFKRYFFNLDTAIKALETRINTVKCRQSDSLIDKYVLIKILEDIKTSYSVKALRLKNLQNAFNLVKDAADKASLTSPAGAPWFGEPVNVTVTDNKISILTVTINNSGLEIKNGEIVQTTSSVSFKKVLRFRRFHTFIPEVSAGIAYTSLSFPKYGTTTDAAGVITVSSAGEDDFKKLNVTAMINFVHYSDEPVTWFWQLGIGAKSDYPTLLTGLGLRFDVSGKTLALSVGGASTWVKSLTKYHIGSIVTGTSDVENDLSYEFKLPKLYVGIQYNF